MTMTCVDCGGQYKAENKRGPKPVRCSTCRDHRRGAKYGQYTCVRCAVVFGSDRKKKYCGTQCQQAAGQEASWRTVACAGCGVRFMAKRKVTTCCSAKCALTVRYKKTQESRDQKWSRTCIGCGSIFRKKPGGNKGEFCTRECAYEHHAKWHRDHSPDAQEARILVEMEQMAEAPALGMMAWCVGWKKCGWCSCLFWSQTNAAMCGNGCYHHAKVGDWRRCEKCGCEVSRKNEPGVRQCLSCREEAQRESRDRTRLKRAARLESQFVERVSRKKVFKRDRYQCWICLGPCKRTYTANDMASPTLDHVIPVTKGGKHSYANCRTAHAICNSLKGDAE